MSQDTRPSRGLSDILRGFFLCAFFARCSFAKTVQGKISLCVCSGFRSIAESTAKSCRDLLAVHFSLENCFVAGIRGPGVCSGGRRMLKNSHPGVHLCWCTCAILPNFGRHLVVVWIGGVWNGHFPESEKLFSEAEISRKMPEIPQKERFLPNFRLRNLKIRGPKNAIPYPQPFHTPTRLPSKIGLLTSYSCKHLLPKRFGNRPNTLSESTVSSPELTEFFALAEFRGESSSFAPNPGVKIRSVGRSVGFSAFCNSGR